MDDKDERIIDRIEKLIRLASSDNESEAKAAMLKAQEIMAKYKISEDRLEPEKEKDRPVVCFTSLSFRDDWVQQVSLVIAENFRCRVLLLGGNRGSFRIRFYGYEEDAEICINIFNYAIKVTRKRIATLRAIYADAGREFGPDEKWTYALGFCNGLDTNFREQKEQNESFALALLVPEAVNRYVDEIPGVVDHEGRNHEMGAENRLLFRTGYVDGKAFQNAGDKERISHG